MDFTTASTLLRTQPLPLLLALAVSLFLAGRAIYRLTLHPLAYFPGPKLAGASQLYRIYFDIWYKGGGEMYRQLEHLHQVYGPVVRYGPNALHFSDPHAYYDIYRMGSDMHKQPDLYAFFGASDSLFGFMDHRKHKERRDLLNPMFQRKAVLQLEHALHEKTDDLVARLALYTGTRTPTPVNMHYALRALTVDVIAAYCFGRSTTCLATPGFAHPFITTMSSWIDGGWVLRWMPLASALMNSLHDDLAYRIAPSARPLIDIRRGLQVQIADTLRADKEGAVDAEVEGQNVLMRLLSSVQEKTGTRISHSSLLTEMQTFMLAGSDTIAVACYAGLFFALAHPPVLARLRTELDAAWPDVREPISFQALEKLPYLTAFIKESMRVSTPIPAPLERIPEKPMRIAGVEVPADVSVSIAIGFIHMNKDIFPDPHVFRPERWLTASGSSGKEGEAGLDEWLVAFSRGSRSCIGQSLAWAEMYIICGNLLRKLDLEIYDTEEADIMHTKTYFGASHSHRKDFHALVKGVRA